MKDNTILKRIRVDHYGPLGDIDLELDEGLNVFYGGNESGKTLLVEAITRMLLENESGFNGIERVSQQPTGMLIGESNGEEMELSQEPLENLFDDVNADDIRNAFIIRDFDLRLPEKQNDFGSSDYFNDVTDRVLGSKTNKIEGIRDEIADFSYLTNNTADSKIENRKSTGHLRKKKEEAEELKDEIRSTIEEIRSEGLVEKYRRIERLQRAIETQKNKIEELKQARKNQRYRQGQQIISQVEDIQEKLSDIEEEEQELEDAYDIKQDAEAFEPVKISDYQFFRKASTASTAVSAASIAASIAVTNPLPAAMAILSFLTAIYTGYRYWKSSRKVEESDIEKEELLEKAEAKGIEAENLADISEQVDNWRQSIDNRRGELKEQRGDLAGTFRAKFNTSAEDLDTWRDIIEDFSSKTEEIDRDYSEGDINEAEQELEDKQEELSQLENELGEYDDRFQKFDSRLSKVIRQEFVEDLVEISVFEDMERAERQLNEFISNLDEMKDTAQTTLELLKQMEEEEEDEFNRIFNKDSYAVEMFREATDGAYQDINYDKAERQLEVERSDGQVLSPKQLSQGTYDLLYMSVRLKLAKEIIGEPGFLVLDNAFVHSDIDRIHKEAEFLQKLEDEGWQIIYFTFRDDVKNQLEEIVDVRELNKLDF